MKKRVFALTGFLFMLMIGACSGLETVTHDTDLLSVVIVSRHGIRSPTTDLSPYTLRPQGFPLWSRPADIPGNLSTKGKGNVTKLGVWYRDFYTARGLFPPRGTCPAEETVSHMPMYLNGPDRQLRGTSTDCF